MLYADWRRPQETHVWEDGWRWSFTICASYRGDGCGTGAVTAHKTSEAALLLVGFIQMLLLLFFFFLFNLSFSGNSQGASERWCAKTRA